MTHVTPTFSCTGVGVSPGRVIGPALSMPGALVAPADEPRDPSISAEAAEEALVEAARAVSQGLKARADEASGDAKGVLEATALMATDSTLLKTAKKSLAKGKTAERAFFEAAAEITAMFAALGGKMAERQRDVQDVRDRVIAQLRGVTPPGIPHSAEPFVLIADDLAPADTATLDPSKVLALVTSEGGPQSHTAIIARSLGLPAVVAAHGAESITDGTEVHVDGSAGIVSTLITDELRAEVDAYRERRNRLPEFSGTGQLKDGTSIPLLANVGNARDARAAMDAHAQGVGLFRTEFLFLDRDAEPEKAEQVAAYQGVFSAVATTGNDEAPAKVVLRTLDAGADKPLPFLTGAQEPNPALGVRGFRTELAFPGVLRRQLEAVAEAAAAVRQEPVEIWVMAPMISTAEEARTFRQLAEEAGVPQSGCAVGLMVEVPAAALMAAEITSEVDFVSIGTNDLTQYTMASDRQLGSLAALNDSWQPAVLKLIRATAEGSSGPVGVCGEAAADPALAAVLVGLGVDTLSMSSSALDAVSAVLASVTAEEARVLADLALSSPTADQAREDVRNKLPALAELGLS